jgi:hypothetical protein
MNRNPLLASISWRMLLSLALVVALSLAVVPFDSQASRRPSTFPAPAPLNPSDQLITVANYPPRAVPYFEWQPISGAARYQIQIAQDIGFTQIRYDTTTTNTRFLTVNDDSFPDGDDVYWRVRVVEPSVGDWPLIPWHFARNWATNNAPALTAPASGTTIKFFEMPVFSWTPVIGAAFYVLAIDNDLNCQSPLYQYNTGETRYNPLNRISNGTYYWNVRAYDKASHGGGSSECRPFTMQYDYVTILLQPENSSFPVYTPQFKWTAVKGAVAYWLYYSTDSTFQSGVISIRTTQTTYTPHDSLPNDINYYWKVRVEYPGGLGPDSAIWTFQKRWYHKPIILTPRNNEAANMMLLSWTPVREAAYYKIEASYDPGFPPGFIWETLTPNTFFWRDWAGPVEWVRTQYVRVRPYDRNGNSGKDSLSISYRPTYTLALPEHVFPRYYYPPASIPSGNYGSPYDIPVSYDYTVNTPTFYWSRVFVPGVDPRVEASRYRIEVDDDVNFIGTPNWTYETPNLSATPTTGVPFVPISTTLYYWRVTPLAESGAVLTGSVTNQPWAVRIDTSRLTTPTTGISPILQRPPQGEKTMDTLPSFEWLPYHGAARYELTISAHPNLTPTVYVAQTVYTHHTPSKRLPQGTYFWSVRALNAGGQQVGQPSETRRFISAYQTRLECAGIGSLASQTGTLLASDADDGVSNDLANLYAAQDGGNWFVGFSYTPTIASPVTFTLYFDGNQAEGQGANVAPLGRPNIKTVGYYRPEYAVNVRYDGSQIDVNRVELFKWDSINTMWDPQIKNLVDPIQVGGSIYVSPTFRITQTYVELALPKTAIGDAGFDPFALSLALFSTTSNGATSVADSVPDNGVAATSVLTEFVSIADRMNLSIPVADQALSPTSLTYTPYMYAETANVDYFHGFRMQVSRDPLFTSVMDSAEAECFNCENYVDAFQNVYSPIRVYEDNTLYWRYFIRHTGACAASYGPPSEAHIFTKLGPVPAKLQIASQYSTPTFTWNDVETAAYYRIQVASNPDFSGNIVDDYTNHDNFTPSFPIVPGKYYWRVRSLNDTNGGYASAWSVSSTVNITLPMVTLWTPASGATIHSTPTFTWVSVLTPTNQPEWTGVTYRLQVSDSPNGFTAPYRDYILDTVTFTPPDAFPDKTYYWRVAVRDASGNEGPYSRVFTFTKQYPVTTLLAPLTGAQTGGFPTFKWTAINGAAYYHIQIAKNPQFSQPVRDEIVDNVWYILTDRLQDASYYWRVAMIDRNGNHGPYNDATLIVSAYPYHVYLPVMRR